jgi:hypothetical protein
MSEVEQQSPAAEAAPEAAPAPEVAEAATPAEPEINIPENAGRQEKRDAIMDGLKEFLEKAEEDSAIQEDPILSGEGGHTGIDYTTLPEDAKKLLANMRSDYTRKTQELAHQRRALEAQQAAMAKNEDFFKSLEETASQELEFNPYDEASFQQAVKQEVAKKLQEAMRPMREEHMLQQRRAQLDNFKTRNPDFDDLRTDISKILIANEHMKTEEAYWIVKGQKLATQQSDQAHELNRYREAAKAAGLKVGGSSRARSGGVPESVKKQGSFAIYKYLEANKSK